jgi:valyl-tRNA synthetase
MEKQNIEEIKSLFNECKELKEEVYKCHKELKFNFDDYRNQMFKKLSNNSDSTITDLKMVLAYLKKHNEMKMIYNSYKELLREMLQYKKKLIYFSHLSRPLITEQYLESLLKEQNDLMENVSQMNDMLPKLD